MVVEHSTTDPEVEGSNPASALHWDKGDREKKKFKTLTLSWLLSAPPSESTPPSDIGRKYNTSCDVLYGQKCLGVP